MFCISCGVALTENNQEGIVCQTCRYAFERKEAQIVTVKYCYICGKRFIPSDSAISHSHCLTSIGEEDGNIGRGCSM